MMLALGTAILVILGLAVIALSYMFGRRVWPFLRLVLFFVGIVGAIVGLTYLVFYFQEPIAEALGKLGISAPSFSPDWGSWWAYLKPWLIGLAIVAAVVGLIYAVRRFGFGVPALAAGTFAMTPERWGYLLTPLVVLALLLVLIPGLFPGFSAHYVAMGGPVWLLMLGLLIIAAVALTPIPPWGRQLAAIVVGAMLLIAMAYPVTSYWHGSFRSISMPSLPSFSLPSLTASAARDCNGTRRSFDLTGSESLINGGLHCELVGWNATHDVVLFGDRERRRFEAGPGQRFSFRATHWKCADASACTVIAVFCPLRYRWDDARNVCTPPRV